MPRANAARRHADGPRTVAVPEAIASSDTVAASEAVAAVAADAARGLLHVDPVLGDDATQAQVDAFVEQAAGALRALAHCVPL